MRYIYRNGKVVEADSAGPIGKPWVTGVISDTMAPAKHHATGKIHDSKARFRADTRATGCVEIGNEPIRPRAPIRLDKRERKEAIRKSIYDLRNGHRPPTF